MDDRAFAIRAVIGVSALFSLMIAVFILDRMNHNDVVDFSVWTMFCGASFVGLMTSARVIFTRKPKPPEKDL